MAEFNVTRLKMSYIPVFLKYIQKHNPEGLYIFCENLKNVLYLFQW